MSNPPKGFDGSGADWLPRYKPYIEDGKTVVVSPHKVWGPQTNDLVFQLRKNGIQKVILCGMLANLCVESHLRELIEQAELVHDFERRGMDGVAAEIAQEIGVFFQHQHIDTSARQQEAQHHACRASAGNGAARGDCLGRHPCRSLWP